MITYANDRKVEAKDVAEVFKNSGIKRPYDDLERIQKMIDHADITVSAWSEGKLIGIARAITDYAYCCYLSDLAVDKQFQNQQVGKKLVAHVQELIGEQVTLILISAPGAMDFYPKIGFEKNERAFTIPRKR
ncbi:GNAT family N-acetyltransferase [Cohnella yongneupensis]|uniref:GNAT family N-acetyltransferase n=1 Tax=Cohnella yongneupensis TaxID=425006 RepID=A0ABW0QUT0_9BACL